MSTPKTYTDNFYPLHVESAISSAREIIPLVLKFIRPESVIDVGCGTGAWLSIWKEYGVKKIIGLDGNHINPTELLINKDEFISCNLEEDFFSGSQYDLVSCLEVAEHLRPGSAKSFINSICKFSDTVIFSAAIPNQEGTLHLNEQYPTYWIDLFAQNDFEVLDIIRNDIWDNAKIAWWYRQNLLLFARKNIMPEYLKNISVNKKVISMVHPALLEHKQNRITEYEKVLKNPLNTLLYFFKRFLKWLSFLVVKK